MNTDLRGFEYPLQPLRTRQQWRLDALNAQLAGVLRELTQTQARREVVRAGFADSVEVLSEQMLRRWDSAMHVGSLRWLAQRQASLQALDRHLGALRDRRAELVAQCLACQKRLDVVDEHRTSALREFARAASARAASEADRDWLTRTRAIRP